MSVIVSRRPAVFAAGAVTLCLALPFWVFTLEGGGTGMSVRAMTRLGLPPYAASEPYFMPWSLTNWITFWGMWSAMMLAMMYTSVAAHLLRHPRPIHGLLGFLVAYGLIWIIASLGFTATQYGLERVGLFHPHMMWSTSKGFAATSLVAVGLYQLSPYKARLRRSCGEMQSGLSGGARYGIQCLLCTAPLMLLFFTGGAMNLYWMAGLTITLAFERAWPKAQRAHQFIATAIVAIGLMCGVG